jgi:outer membrane protein assembly factor BamA
MSRGGVVLPAALLCSLLGSFPVWARVPAKSTGMIEIPTQSKVIIDTVEIDDATHLPDAIRNQLVGSLEHQEFEGNSAHWFDKKLDDLINAAVPDQTDRDVGNCYRILSRDSSGDIHVSLTIEFKENPLTTSRLASIRFVNASDPKAATLFPPGELRNLFPLRDGELFRREPIRQGLGAVRSLYASRGYIDAVTSVRSEYSSETHSVSIVMEIGEGPQYHVRNILVVGLDPTLEGALRSKLKPGDVMNFKVIRDFYKDNKSVMPTDASPQDVKLTRDPENAVVDLSFDFRALPR